MDQNSESATQISEKYFKYLIVILILVLILDNYTQFYSNVIPSKIVEEFLGNYPKNEANSIFAISLAIISIGSYVVFFVWYSADKVGRKFLLVLSIFGMVAASIGILFSRNIVEYTIYRFFLGIFVGSDIWLIYVTEESPPEKKAFWTNIVLVGGMIGVILMPVFRSIYITETSPVGAWRGMTYFSIIFGIPLGILVCLTVKETSKFQEIREKRPTTKDRTKILKKNLSIIFKSENKRRRAYIAILIISLIRAVVGVFISLGELYMANSPYLNEGDINLVVYVLGISVVIGFLMTGMLADKIGRKPLFYIFFIILIIGALIFTYGAVTPGIALILVCIGMSMINIAYWGLYVILSIVVLELIPTEARGTGNGFRGLMGSFGSTLGLVLTGIFVYYVSLQIIFLIFALMLLIDLPIIYKYVIETKGTDLSDIKLIK
ncbi:MAG: MFS transporter [Promethearchaeota archaeon]